MTTFDTPAVMGESTIFVEYQKVRRMSLATQSEK
jgi:hypothetical protein